MVKMHTILLALIGWYFGGWVWETLFGQADYSDF